MAGSRCSTRSGGLHSTAGEEDTAQLVSWINETEPLVREAQPAGKRRRRTRAARYRLPGLPFLDPGTFATGLLGRYHVTHHSHRDVCACHSSSSSHIAPCVCLLPAPLRCFHAELTQRTWLICGTMTLRNILVQLLFARLPSKLPSLLFPSHKRTRCLCD